MTDYLQPDFYRFNEDSLRLVKRVLGETQSAVNILDLGAGSGVIGIELARILKPRLVTLVELQKDFIPYLQKNCEIFLGEEVNFEIVESNFSSWNTSLKYDLIVANPPYFLPGHGERSQDERKGMARSFIRDDWKILLEKIHDVLALNGKAFLVVRKDSRIRQEIEKAGRHFRLSFIEEEHLYFVELTRLNENGGKHFL